MKRKMIAGIYIIAILVCCFLLCRYIFYYNTGNKHFENQDYESAITAYTKALNANPPKGKECPIRINMALSMIHNLPDNYDETDQREDSIDTLKKARKILLKEDCATDDGDGHSQKAQKLKDEIDELIEQLKNQPEEGADDTPNKDPQEEDTPTEETDMEQTIKEKLQQNQSDAYEERRQELQLLEELQQDYNFDISSPIW